MKVRTSIILLVLFLIGCSSVDSTENIKLVELEKCEIDWNQIEIPLDWKEADIVAEMKPINTNEAAIELGTRLLWLFHSKGRITDSILLGITHYTETNVWLFSYSIDPRPHNYWIDHSLVYVAIDGNKGDLIEIWYEE